MQILVFVIPAFYTQKVPHNSHVLVNRGCSYPVVVQGPQEADFKYKEHNPEAAEKTEHWQHQ
jgi:hypothetical protein